MTERLLVVGATTMRETAFVTWQRMGFDVVLVDGVSSARYEHLVDEFIALDQRDGSADLEAIRAIARDCDGITTLADDSQLTVATIAEDLGLPGIGKAAALAARSKAMQRQLCAAAGMRVPKWREVHGPAGIDEYYGSGVGERAVLKPIDASGGAGVMQAGSLAEAKSLWPLVRSFSPSRTGLIEEFLDGTDEVCVEAIVLSGSPVFVSVTEAVHLQTAGFVCVAARYATEQPHRVVATEVAAQIATAVGLRDGLIHAELKVGDDGWSLIEIALRPGGGLVPEMTKRATGADFYRAQALLAMGATDRIGEALGSPSAPHAQVRYLVAQGEVQRFVPPVTVLADLPDVRSVHQQVLPGQRVREPVSDGGRAGYVVGWGDDPVRLDEQLRVAEARLCQGMGLTMVSPREPLTPSLASA